MNEGRTNKRKGGRNEERMNTGRKESRMNKQTKERNNVYIWNRNRSRIKKPNNR